MIPPVLGLKTDLPSRLHRRIGANAAAMLAATLALPAAVDVAPVGAQEAPPHDIADRLVESVAGYTVMPEGTGTGNSQAVTLEDLAAIAGVDVPDHPGGTAAGYLRLFGKPTGDGVAAALAFDIGSGDAADFVAGFRDESEAQASPLPLFPDTASPGGDVVAYEVANPASSLHALVTAFASDSLVVVLLAADPDDSAAVLRQMAQDQVALTPPTAGGAEKRQHPAYTLGRILGGVAIVCVPAWLIIRAVRQPRQAPAGPAAPVGPAQTASRDSFGYPARRPGIPLPPLEPGSQAPPPPPPWAGSSPPRRPGIPLPPLEPGSED